jgi:4a-hydroxytetrahydrobiopterin dehydratase
MAAQKLRDEELNRFLDGSPGWTVKEGKLHREYRFADFAHAFGFMAICAIQIEGMNHHPEWCNVYSQVTVDLTTHDSGGITANDVVLARILDGAAAKLIGPGA